MVEKEKPLRRQRQPKGQTASLRKTHPELAKQWHPFYNGDKRPEDFTDGSNVVVWWLCPRSHDHVFQQSITIRTRSRAQHKACPYCSGKLASIIKPLRRPGLKFKQSMLDTHLAVAAQWDQTQNGWWMPEDFTAGSNFVAWWNCPLGHNFEQKICHRTGTTCLSMGCPECGILALMAYRREAVPLSITHPQLAEQWDYESNDLTPEDVTRGSSKYVYWICPHGPDHQFLNKISRRASSPTTTMACPFCAGKLPSVTNSLASLYPKIAKEYSKRNMIRLEDVVAKSNKRAWWLCSKCSHEWQTTPGKRICNSSGCPRCNLGEPIDLSKFPMLWKLFDHKRNEGVDPRRLRKQEKCWWRCPKGKEHVFFACATRREIVEKCPFCRNRKVSDKNNIATLYPKVAKEFHPTKNGKLTAKDVVPGARQKIWWQCRKQKDHVWQAYAYSRTKDGAGCPFCCGLRASKTNNLAKLYPKIAKELHPTRNGSLTAKELLPRSGKSLWWRCSRGHVYQRVVWVRTGGAICPKCKGSG